MRYALGGGGQRGEQHCPPMVVDGGWIGVGEFIVAANPCGSGESVSEVLAASGRWRVVARRCE